MRVLIALAASLTLYASPMAAAVSGPGNVDTTRVEHEPAGSWLMQGRDFTDQHFSPLKAINFLNANRLGFAWEFRDFIVHGVHRGMESSPIMVDGVLYFSGPWGTAYALDAHDGKLLWSFDPQADGQYARSACCDVVNRGVAVWKGRVYVGSLDGFLFALDARTGKTIWRADTFVDRKFNATITGAPHIAGGNVVIGQAGADMGSRGYVSAYDLETGKLAWRFWVVPGDPVKGPDENAQVTFARKTWAKDTRWDLGGGGDPWDSMVYDPKTNLVYIGTGNGGPHPIWLRSPRGGDNLFLSSIVALDATSGEMKWYYQETPGDSWDYASTSPIVMADIPWQGRTRKVIMQAPKNGIFYVLDRETGELLSAKPFTTVNWTDGIDMKTGRPHLTVHANYAKRPQIIWPSAAGGHGWQPMSFDPDTGYVYLPVYDAPMKYRTNPVPKLLPGGINQGTVGTFPPYETSQDRKDLVGQPIPKMEGRLKAWDPETGEPAWESGPLPFLNGGTLSTAGGLVFAGTSDGVLTVYDAKSGKVLKRLVTGTSIMAAPITYDLDGVQYIAVLAGAGGPQNPIWAPTVAASKYENYERLLVLRLGGGPVPLPPKAVPPPREATPKPIAASAATIAHGRALFEQQCQRCHIEGGAIGAYPDLWNLPPNILDSFEAVVYAGALREGGMASFADNLTKNDVAAIKAFIVNDEIEKRKLGEKAGAHSRARYH